MHSQRKEIKADHGPERPALGAFHQSRKKIDTQKAPPPPPARGRVVCWSTEASTRQHKKSLVSGTIGAFRWWWWWWYHRRSDEQTSRCTNREHSVEPTPGLCHAPLCDSPSGCCFFTGPWTVTRSSLRMLRRVAAFCRPLQRVLLLVSFPRLRGPVVAQSPPPSPQAWGLRDDRIPGTDQAVRGGRHGQWLHSGSPPPRQGDARGSADARSSTDACLS